MPSAAARKRPLASETCHSNSRPYGLAAAADRVSGELPPASCRHRAEDLDLSELPIDAGTGDEDVDLRVQGLNGSQGEGVAQRTAKLGFMARCHDVATDVDHVDCVDRQEFHEFAELPFEPDRPVVWVEEVAHHRRQRGAVGSCPHDTAC
jgi:hypothetical protein